jgi:hypothetical protein
MNQNSYPQPALIGAPKTAVDTPVLLVDLDVMEANMARVLATCRKNGVAWRPHCKGHKSPDIARREVAAGAIGVTCAKLGEAEVMAAAGISDILIANQVVGAAKVARLMQLLDKARVVVAVDSVANVEELARAATSVGKTAEVVIEVDVGMQRAGVAPGDPVLVLAKEIAARPGVKLVGLFTWESQATRIADQAEKARVVQSALSKVASTAKACADAGHNGDRELGGRHLSLLCGATRHPNQASGAIFSDVHYREHYHTDLPHGADHPGDRNQPAEPYAHHSRRRTKGHELRHGDAGAAGTACHCGGQAVGRAWQDRACGTERYAAHRRQDRAHMRLLGFDRVPARSDRGRSQGAHRGHLAAARARQAGVGCLTHTSRISGGHSRRTAFGAESAVAFHGSIPLCRADAVILGSTRTISGYRVVVPAGTGAGFPATMPLAVAGPAATIVDPIDG